MSIKKYRWFGGLMGAQERWLNRMSAKGLRLMNTGRLVYEFEECPPNAYLYRLEFIADRSRANALDYADFLRDCGCRVFFKNTDLNFSVGKVRLRPWAEAGGRIATSSTTYGRELLIVEKADDGKPFVLHSTYADRLSYCKRLMAPWAFLLIVSALCGAVMGSAVWWVFAGVSLAALAIFLIDAVRLRRAADIQEQ